MSWKVRHEGSPKFVEVASAQEVLHDLVDGLWEPTDEVRGPQDTKWVALENHPQFAEAASEIEPLPKFHEDESKLDMNALIDVCLVLLIFYILTTTYAQLQAQIKHPSLQGDDAGPAKVTDEEIKNQMIRVTIRLEGDKPVFRIEDKVVEEGQLVAEFRRFVSAKHTTTVLLVFEGDVTNKTLTMIEDAATVAGVDRINWGVK